MKISEENSKELINSYLDNESTQRELELISKLIAEDEDFASMFCEYKNIYIATAKHYSKKIKLPILPKHKAKRPSVIMGNLEWCAVLVLMVVCVYLLKTKISESSESYIRSLGDEPAFADDSFGVKVCDFFVENYNYYSLFELEEKR